MTVDLLPDLSDDYAGRALTRPDDANVCRAHVPLDESTDVRDLARRYLGEPEAAAFAAMAGRGRIPWLLGRVAAKDAVRAHLAKRDFAPIDPTRIIVRNDTNGRPKVEVRGARLSTRGVHVSIAHKPTVAVAIAARIRLKVAPVAAVPVPAGVGIDVESVEPRPANFANMILSRTERSLLDATADDRDTWLTRVWTVKEAAAKATGLGLRGRPKDFEVDAVEDDLLRCCGRWITTAPLAAGGGPFIVAWTASV